MLRRGRHAEPPQQRGTRLERKPPPGREPARWWVAEVAVEPQAQHRSPHVLSDRTVEQDLVAGSRYSAANAGPFLHLQQHAGEEQALPDLGRFGQLDLPADDGHAPAHRGVEDYLAAVDVDAPVDLSVDLDGRGPGEEIAFDDVVGDDGVFKEEHVLAERTTLDSRQQAREILGDTARQQSGGAGEHQQSFHFSLFALSPSGRLWVELRPALYTSDAARGQPPASSGRYAIRPTPGGRRTRANHVTYGMNPDAACRTTDFVGARHTCPGGRCQGD